MQGRLFAPDRIGAVYDRAEGWLLKKAASIGNAEWERGMYYPTRWDPNFSEFMTVDDKTAWRNLSGMPRLAVSRADLTKSR